MDDAATNEDARAWHRRFAVDANNRAWALSEQATLTEGERAELLHAAHTAAYHWSKIGTASQTAHAHLLLGRAHGLLGQGDLAMTFAASAFRTMTGADAAPWERALAHAVLAGAAAAAGNAQLHAEHYEHARIFTDALADPEDKEIVMATFRTIPLPGRGPDDDA